VGTIITNVPDYQDFGTWDEVTNIDVTVPSGKTLVSATKAEVYINKNIALFGDEIMGYRNALLIDPNKYRLTGLLRGLRGTDWAAPDHTAGERFVVLAKDGTIVPIIQSQIDLDAVVSSVQFTFRSRNLDPLSPTKIEGTWDGPDNLTITWFRRARIEAEWIDGIDVPLDESVEFYEVDVFDGATLLRTITNTASANGSVVTALSQSAFYDVADQTADGISAGADVTAQVYQISSRVGRGRPGTRLLTRSPFTSLPNQRTIVPAIDLVLTTIKPIVVSTP